jgi:dTDP-4-amino-4,6-dideoxygalactose transaminase
MQIPFYDLKWEYEALRDEIRDGLDRVCRKSAFVLGEEVEAFEKEFAEFCEVKHCVALNSGTSALHLGLLSLGVQDGDEVITTPNTFIATAEAINYCSARPVFVDIDPGTANLDPRLVERAITKRTKAMIPVHLYGRPADMEPLLEIAARNGLAVLEDASQAHGARYRGKRVGSLANAATFSFYPSKNLAAYGEGGALVSNDDRVAQYARAARTHGQQRRYEHSFIGFNYRMEGFQGAILRIKLRRLPEWTARRRHIAALYRELLDGAPVEIPRDDPRDEPVYHLFSIYSARRDALRRHLESKGIETAVHYPKPLHLQPAFASLGCPPNSFPHAESACSRVLSLPLFPALTDDQVRQVAAAIREFSVQCRSLGM